MSDSQRTSNPQLWPIEREELIRWHRQCSQGCTMQDDFNGAAMHNRRATQLEAGAAHEPTSALEPDAVVVNDNQPHWTGIFETQPNVTLPVGTRLVRIEKAQAWEIIAKNRGKLIAGQCSAEPPTCKPLLHIFSAQGDPCLCGAVPWGKPSNTPTEPPVVDDLAVHTVINSLHDDRRKRCFEGECARTACSNRPAVYFNKSTKWYYCESCAAQINRYAQHTLCTIVAGGQEALDRASVTKGIAP
jgi:hypothetical protein